MPELVEQLHQCLSNQNVLRAIAGHGVDRLMIRGESEPHWAPQPDSLAVWDSKQMRLAAISLRPAKNTRPHPDIPDQTGLTWVSWGTLTCRGSAMQMEGRSDRTLAVRR